MPAGRPRTFDPDAALDAAMRTFWHRGYRRTTTRDLEKALGLGQSSITGTFGTKADLLDTALDRYLTTLRTALLDPLHDGPGGLVAIDRFLSELGDWLRADGGRGCMIGRLMCEGADTDPRIAARVDEYRRTIRSALDAALARAVAEREITADGLAERKDLVITMVLGLNLALQAGYDDATHRRLTHACRAQVAGWSD